MEPSTAPGRCGPCRGHDGPGLYIGPALILGGEYNGMWAVGDPALLEAAVTVLCDRREPMDEHRRLRYAEGCRRNLRGNEKKVWRILREAGLREPRPGPQEWALESARQRQRLDREFAAWPQEDQETLLAELRRTLPPLLLSKAPAEELECQLQQLRRQRQRQRAAQESRRRTRADRARRFTAAYERSGSLKEALQAWREGSGRSARTSRIRPTVPRGCTPGAIRPHAGTSPSLRPGP